MEECRDICAAAGIDPYQIVKTVQPIAFENAGWAYTVGAAIAIKKNARTAVEAAKASAKACRHSASPAPSPTTAR